MRDRYAEVQARGAEVVVITPADSVGAARFARRLHLPFPVLADLRRRSFAAYGLYEATWAEVLRPEVLTRAVRELVRGNTSILSPAQSSFTQLGGLFVVDTAGIVRFGHVATPIFNYPTLEAWLAVLDETQRLSDNPTDADAGG